MSILDTAEYRRLALIAAGVDPCDIPCILDTAAWRRLMLKALYDLSQGGGGSPGYINGSVQFYTDLPVTVGTPAVNTAYLVRENSGVWFINRKPAGIYVRLFNNGNLNDWDYAGTFPEVNDAQYFRIYDSADPTREVAFNVSGISTGTTRTITVPNKNVTLDDASDARTPTAHTHAASAITSGVFDNERINFASPSAIGAQIPNTGLFTNLSVASRLNLPSSGSNANDIWVSSGQVRYQAGSLVTSARTLLSAEDNLSNLDNTATARTNLGVGSSSAVTFGSIQNTPIGSTTPAAGSFTNLLASAELTVPAVTPASPSTGDLYRTTDMLRYRDSSNTERILLNNLDNLANLSNTATARTNIGLGSANDVTFGSIQNTPIGSTTRNSGAFTSLSAAPTSGSALTLTGGTVTASAPLIDATQTWNNAAVAFTGVRLNITNTASAAASWPVDFQVGGSSQFRVRRSGGGVEIAGTSAGVRISDYEITGLGGGLAIRSGSGSTGFNFDSGTITTLSANTNFVHDGVLFEQRRTTSPVTMRLYNTFTDASNYERGFMRWSSNVFQIGTEKGGTGSARALEFQTDGVTRATLGAAGGLTVPLLGGSFSVTSGAIIESNSFRAGSNGSLIFTSGTGGSGGSYDTELNREAAGVFRIRSQAGAATGIVLYNTLSIATNYERAFARWSSNVFQIGTEAGGTGTNRVVSITSGTNIEFNTSNNLRWLIGGSSGALQGADTLPILFGGSTASFPRLANSGAVLRCQLADASGYAVFEAQLRTQGAAPATSGAAGTAGDIRYDADYIYICTAANTWKRAAIATW